MAGIELINVHKQYRVEDRTVPVLRGIGLQIPERQITVILGRSGCGKTTLLRLTGGLEEADAGEIRYEGPHRTAFVFQEPRLMPWLNIWKNITFGQKSSRIDRDRIERLIETVGLTGFEKAYP
uniref:ATP-binding cassette domain-containing protein n=1 Tax=Enterocloster asparagiformis TaxID=333367 RepID=UPI0033201C60